MKEVTDLAPLTMYHCQSGLWQLKTPEISKNTDKDKDKDKDKD